MALSFGTRPRGSTASLLPRPGRRSEDPPEAPASPWRALPAIPARALRARRRFVPAGVIAWRFTAETAEIAERKPETDDQESWIVLGFDLCGPRGLCGVILRVCSTSLFSPRTGAALFSLGREPQDLTRPPKPTEPYTLAPPPTPGTAGGWGRRQGVSRG